MSNPGLWIVDPETQEDRFVSYQELEDELVQSYIKPVGGFAFEANLFMLSKLPPVPFYLKDWLPKRGKSQLYASAKAGKSTLSVQLARCIGQGEEFLGMPTTKGRVLYIQSELGEEVLQERLKRTGKSYDNVFVGTVFSLKLDSLAGQKQLWRVMEAVEPNVLILDPWYKLLLGDENESQDVRKVVDFLDTVIEGFACSIFVIHHVGKELSKRGRGSTVLEDWVDSYIQMRRTSPAGDPLRVKINPIFLRHASLPPGAIEAELGKDFEFHLVGPSVTIKHLVEAYLKATTQEVSPKEIFAAQIGSNTSVYIALEELVREGKVTKERRGRYRWVGLDSR